MDILFAFVFHYPLFMSFVQMIGAIIYQMFREPKEMNVEELPAKPIVSVLIPCHNEANCIEETIKYLGRQEYDNIEIIAINDASTDNTLQILRELQKEEERLRIVNMTTNQGKGMGLNMASLIAKVHYIITIDADALLSPRAVKHFMWHFLKFPRVGAITGNPRIRNRTSILGKIQVGEFSSIISMIKRSQRILGKVFTISGVIAAFRKRALFRVGFWSNNMVTEDIDVSWKLQTDFWDIRYEPRALCWILMPETIRGLWRQRLRWSQGGSEVLKKYFKTMFSWKQRRIWPIYLEYFLSVFWSYCFAMTILLFLAGLLMELPDYLTVASIFPGYTGVILSVVCLIQLTVGLILDSRYERGVMKLFFWLIWYPAIYWVLNAAVCLFAFPIAMFKPKHRKAVWESPDRGL